ncbi:hypothetical protein OQA88_9643 [Cercophora sp. LCS_1]
MDLARSLELPGERLNRATAIAAPFFTDPIANSLRNPKQPDIMSLGGILEDAALSGLWNDLTKLDRHPASMADFLTIASSVFSEQHLGHIGSQAKNFDAASGISDLSDYFISSRPAIAAIKDVIWAIAEHSTAESSREATVRNPPTTTSETEATQEQQQPPAPHNTIQPGQQSSSGSGLLVGSGEVGIPCPIQQIDLEGPTISEAWRANATTSAMEDHTLSVGPNVDPSSMSFRVLPVYHGAGWKVEDNQLGANALRGGPLQPSVSENQVAPIMAGALPVVWTGFSPLRCFLWAAFGAEVLQEITVAAKARLERSWDCPTSTPGSTSSHTHSGVILFKFRPYLPSAPGNTHYVMPKDRAEDWKGICNNINHIGLTPPDFGPAPLLEHIWDRFSTIHGGAINTWPNALHCHEFGPQLHMLRSWARQLWRTVWFGTGVSALNNSREVTYAISFKLTAPAPPVKGEKPRSK